MKWWEYKDRKRKGIIIREVEVKLYWFWDLKLSNFLSNELIWEWVENRKRDLGVIGM